MLATFAVRSVGDLMVVRQGTKPTIDAEWDEFLALLPQTDEGYRKLRVLILTEGAGPDRAQRERLQKVLAGRSVRTAVVSDSAKVLFVVTIIALMNREHRGFSKRELHLAYAHLNLTPAQRATAERVADELTHLLDSPSQRHGTR